MNGELYGGHFLGFKVKPVKFNKDGSVTPSRTTISVEVNTTEALGRYLAKLQARGAPVEISINEAPRDQRDLFQEERAAMDELDRVSGAMGRVK